MLPLLLPLSQPEPCTAVGTLWPSPFWGLSLLDPACWHIHTPSALSPKWSPQWRPMTESLSVLRVKPGQVFQQEPLRIPSVFNHNGSAPLSSQEPGPSYSFSNGSWALWTVPLLKALKEIVFNICQLCVKEGAKRWEVTQIHDFHW